MGVLSDIIGIGTGGSGGGDSVASSVSSAMKKKRKGKSDRDNSNAAGDLPGLPDYHRGGKVRKNGAANLRKGEVVMTARQARRSKRR